MLAAAQGGNLDEVERLIRGGVDVNYQDEDGHSALYSAALNRNPEMTALLLGHGAKPHLLTSIQVTPLEIAMSFALGKRDEIEEIVRMLLKAGADPNLFDRSGISLLQIGTWVSEEIFLLLFEAMEHPVDTAVLVIVLQAASVKGYSLAIETLFGCYEDFSAQELAEALITASRNGETEALKILVTHGAKVNGQSQYGETPLGAAASAGKVSNLNLLLSLGADPNPPDCQWTPLHRAATLGHLEVADALISNGADIQVKAHLGRTSIMLAAANLRFEVFQMLFQAGARIEELDGKGLTVRQLVGAGLAERCFESNKENPGPRGSLRDYKLLVEFLETRMA